MNTIYTAIFGKYDKLWEPSVVSNNWKYECYTDEDINSTKWEIIKTKPIIEGDSSRSSRFIKIMRVPLDDEIIIWVDGCVEIVGDMNKLIAEIPNCPLVLQLHPHHTTLEKELIACIGAKKDEEKLMRQQISRYNIKTPYTLTHNNIIIKRGDVKEAMSLWWEEVKNWSKRDQLSFVWSMQQTNQQYCTITNQLARKYFIWHDKHPKK